MKAKFFAGIVICKAKRDPASPNVSIGEVQTS
jgi:hypothetical protein